MGTEPKCPNILIKYTLPYATVHTIKTKRKNHQKHTSYLTNTKSGQSSTVMFININKMNFALLASAVLLPHVLVIKALCIIYY